MSKKKNKSLIQYYIEENLEQFGYTPEKLQQDEDALRKIDIKSLGFTEEECQQYDEAVKNLKKNPISGWGEFVRIILKPISRLDDLSATYFIWSPYFKAAGKKLTKKDCRRIRNNMIRLSDKLYEIHNQNIDEVDSELERGRNE